MDYFDANGNVLPDPHDMSLEDVISRLTKLNAELAKYWSSAEGWAPLSVTEILSKSRLDWQVSLTETLLLWLPDKSKKDLTDGEKILAWTNLGCLIEGTLKLFLSIYNEDYLKSRKKDGKGAASLTLGGLEYFIKEHEILDSEKMEYILHVRSMRNTVHAFNDCDLFTHEEYDASVRQYLNFLRYVNFRLPYSNDYAVPCEC